MKIYMRIKQFSFLAGMFWTLTACANSSGWEGVYSYEADFGENVAGEPVIVEYLLEIDDNFCQLSIQGYQVSEIIVCDAIGTERNLDVMFRSYENGTLKNHYEVQLYNPAQRLFYLKPGNDLVTYWDALVPDESLSKSGKYFLKKAH